MKTICAAQIEDRWPVQILHLWRSKNPQERCSLTQSDPPRSLGLKPRTSAVQRLLTVAAHNANSGCAAIAVGRKLRMGGGFLNRKLSSAKSAEGENGTGAGERELRVQSSELQVAS
jgi:hypothetical protein